MNKRKAYSYSILRYVHDIATGEFINVGVAVHCPSDDFFEVSCRSTLGRLGDTFPDIDANSFRSLIRNTSKRYAELSATYISPLNLEDNECSLDSLLRSVTQKDDSALVWTPAQPGLTFDARKTLTLLFARYVSKYDKRPPAHKRSDEDVWRKFNKGLIDRHIADFFVEKKIEVRDVEVRFKSAWKNGIWHCIEPISFDLSAPESIKEKAHKFLGQVTSVRNASEKFKIYMILGKPENSDLQGAFDTARHILESLPIENEIYLENEADTLLDNLKTQIQFHDSGDANFSH